MRLEGGRPFVLEDFQAEMLTEFFGGARETVILIPKKCGKTTLMAAVCLHHLFRVDGAACYVAAASREQATILYDQARGFVERSPGLNDHITVSKGYRELRSVRDDGRVRVLAADENTADGLLPTLALVDELHRHKSEAMYGILRDGLGPRGGRMVTISTAGADMDSPLGRLRAHAHELPAFVRDDATCRNYATSADGAFVWHEWCLGPDDDVKDMARVKLANPAPWQTQELLRERHDSPSMTPWQWQRFACNVWTEGEQPWIEPGAWDGLAVPGLALRTDGRQVWLGVDLGVRHDTTGIAIVCPQPDGTVHVAAEVLAPKGSTPVSMEKVEATILRLSRTYRVAGVAYDPWSFRRSAELLEGEGVTMIEYPSSPEKMSAASANLYRLIEEGKLRHGADPVLRAHVLAGVTKETERGWRLVKDPRAKRPIDALIALAIGCQVATDEPDTSREAIFI